jgi:3-oxoacyl-[acyl-carrier protein] reductase
MSEENERRIALVTGASRGIGAAIARRLAADGFHVIINHRNSGDAAASVDADIRGAGGSSEVMQADCADLQAVRNMVATVRATHGKLHVLINNAGRTEDGLLLMMPDDKWWAVVRDTIAAVVNPTRALLPLMWKRPGAAVINISSISGIRGNEGQTAYSTGKAAVIGFSKALAREVARKGVSVNCVAPGPIDTEMYRAVHEERQKATLAALPLGRIGRSEEVAELVSMLVGGKAAFVHGQVIAIDGGATI